MDIHLQQDWNESAWQAVNIKFLKFFKGKLMLATNSTECPRVQPPKELTTEAICMSIVVVFCIIFAILGSINTAFEYLYGENFEKKKLRKKTYKKNFTIIFSKKIKRKISNSAVCSKDCTKNMQVNRKRYVSIFKDCVNISRSFLCCFCFIKNGKRLFQTNLDKAQFECFHGIRVISNLSIIFYHIGLYIIYTVRLDEFKPFLQNPISKVLFNACFGVDAFFVLSGFLNAYSFSKVYDKNNGKISWWKFYLKRFVRLTPAYMIVLGFYSTLFCYTGSGPIWPEYKTNPVCKENWWRYLLYINNFELIIKSCMVWCWHLAAEMQIYVTSPIFLLPLLRWQTFGYSLASITIFLSGLSNFLISKQYNLIYCSFVQIDFHIDDFEPLLDRIWLYFDKLYCKPYTRITPYLIGVLLGHYFYGKIFQDNRNRWIILCFGWISAGILIWISFFMLLNKEESVLETALYNGLKHLFFSVGISWIIFVCLTEQKGFINAFLSWKWFLPFSKLSYCVYLIHALILQRDYQAAQDLKEFSLLSLVLYVFRVHFWAFVFAIPVSLLFEMPFINLFDFFVKKEEFQEKEKRKD